MSNAFREQTFKSTSVVENAINNYKAFVYKELRNLMNVEMCLFSKDHDRDTNPTALKRNAEKNHEPETRGQPLIPNIAWLPHGVPRTLTQDESRTAW